VAVAFFFVPTTHWWADSLVSSPTKKRPPDPSAMGSPRVWYAVHQEADQEIEWKKKRTEEQSKETEETKDDPED
jgi:hypothetical protein